jgi:hypothetical protein
MVEIFAQPPGNRAQIRLMARYQKSGFKTLSF